MINLKLLEKLSNAYGPPGHEEEVRMIMEEELKGIVGKVQVDVMGNLIAEKQGAMGKPKIMITAHMDEVGFIITNISEKGFLNFHPMGGVVPTIIPGQTMRIRGEGGEAIGIVGSTPPHITPPEKRDKIPPIEEMYIDIGATSQEEVKARGIDVGATAIFHTQYRELGLGYIMGKAFDDRVGCLILVEVMKKLMETEANITAVATVQEEVGLRGARTAAWTVNPDYAIAIEGTFAADTPEVKPTQIPAKLKGGPVITIADAGMITHPKILKTIVKTAEEAKIPYQFKKIPSGSTDAAAIHLTRSGIPSGAIAVPCRYIHGPAAITHISDIEATINLIVKVILKLSGIQG
jgi:endoglucanase